MPRNGSGVFSLPGGSTVTNGDTSDATDINTPLEDLVTDANTARPIVAGGTGATSAAAARTALGLAVGSDVQAYNVALDNIGLKAPLASPALTGVPTAPTAANGTSTTQIATTAFVQQELIAISPDTYTATLTPTTSGTITLSASADTLSYQRVGDLVTVTGTLSVTSVSSPVGSSILINLPVDRASGDENRFGAGVPFNTGAFSYSLLPMVASATLGLGVIIQDASTVVAGDDYHFTFSYLAA